MTFNTIGDDARCLPTSTFKTGFTTAQHQNDFLIVWDTDADQAGATSKTLTRYRHVHYSQNRWLT